MKALVKTETVNEFKVEEKPKPILEKDEVLIKVEYCGVCGSDLHAASHAQGYEFVPKPIVLGHELSGHVTQVHEDSGIEHLLNKRVVVEPGFYCNECEQCLNGQKSICSNIQIFGLHCDGGMAEFVKINADQIHEIPDTLPSNLAAMTEPLSVALNAVGKVGDSIKDKDVLVQGCGIIGLFVAITAKYHGANVTISGLEKDWEHRLRHAGSFGIETEIVEDTSPKKKDFDLLFECSGSSFAAETGMFRLKKGGTSILVALYEQDVKFPANMMVRGEIDVLSSYGFISSDFQQAFALLDKYKEQLKNIISIYPLVDGAKAFSDANEQKVLKSILKVT